MSQHQQAFLADSLSEVDRVAHRALTILASSRAAENNRSAENTSQTTRLVEPESKQVGALMDRLYCASIAPDQTLMSCVMREMQRSGMSNQTIIGASVPLIARQLGEAWLSDSLSFGAVTIGCARLQTLVHDLADDKYQSHLVSDKVQKNCLVVVPDGTQHTLGAIVLANQMRHSGARVKLALGVSHSAMSSLALSQYFDAIMISATQSESLENLHGLVRNARQNDAKSKIFIGGGLVDHSVDLVARTGTDYVTNDWKEALTLCNA